MDTTQILKIQNELAQRTMAEPAIRHRRLYRLVCDEGWLRSGLEAVLTNRGSNTPGIDGVTKGRIDAKEGEGRNNKRNTEEKESDKDYHACFCGIDDIAPSGHGENRFRRSGCYIIVPLPYRGVHGDLVVDDR